VFLAGALLLALTAPAAAAHAFTLTVTSVAPDSARENGVVTVNVTGDFSINASATTPVFDLVGANRYYGSTQAGWTEHSATVTFTLPDECDGVYDLHGEQYVYGGATPYSDTLPAAFTVHPDLAVTGLNPETCASDHGDLTLTVYGEGFVGSGPIPALHPSVVRWNGTAVPTTVNSATVLTATVPGASLVPGTALVTVYNAGTPPFSTGEVSNARSFPVTPPTPTITSLGPTSAVVGGAAFDLTVTGTKFIAGSVVRWNTTVLPTTVLSATQVRATVPASALATAGSAQITVRNGAEGSPVSNAVAFPVGLSLPALTAITPTQVWAGYVKNDLVLTATGTGFVSGAHIMLGATEKAATTFAGATQLTVPLAAADIATPGTIAVGVKNPDGGLAPATRPLAVVAETTTPSVTIAGADGAWHNSPVTLTFTASDSQSGVQKIQYTCPPAVASWTDGTSYTVPTSTQGSVVVSVQALDWCNAVGTASATVRIDTTQPRTQAQNAVSVRRGSTARLKYRVSEPADLSPTADVVIQVKKSGRVVKTFRFADTPMNSDRTYSFRCTLAKGSYRWYVYATDLAGNRQAAAASNSLRVR
jgi:hypothetical protein